MNFDQINSLTTLLNESQNAKKPSDEGNVKQASNPNITSNSIAVVTREQIQANKLKEEEEKKKANNIWSGDNLVEQDDLRDLNDKRPSPHYEISYKQSIGTEDSLLGMSGITPSSADCSHIIIKIYFPNCKLKDLDVDVKKNRISAESKQLKLFTYLPIAVDHEKGNAAFDSKTHILTVTIPIIKEYNF